MKKITDLIRILPTYQCQSDIETITINSIEMDHREVKQGSLFICVKGFTVDGHDYAQAAVERGAVAVISEKKMELSSPVIEVPDTKKALPLLANQFYDQPTKQFSLIGVTGTNGKTTVSHLINEMFENASYNTGLIGTIQMKINQQTSPVKNTTPDALFLQKSFNEMVENDVDVATMEVSSHALDQGRVHGCLFDMAVFTNLSQDHLDYHNTMDQYLFAKSLLFSQLGNEYLSSRPKYAIINVDDTNALFLIKSTAQPVVTYGIKNEADFYASEVTLHANGSSFVMHTPLGNLFIRSHLMGNFSIYNMLAAAASAYYAGISLDMIKQVLEQTTGVKGRFQPIKNNKGIGVIVDYAHTPDSLENVLDTIQRFSNGNVRVIIGCGGDRDKAKRPLMAEVACRYADEAIFTSDNPRSESPGAIIDDMVDSLTYQNYTIQLDRRKAIKTAIESAKEGDVVLIAGKGHETYQIIGDKVINFDDEQVALSYLK
ncbi:UDP-N-acetylmuramoyl-L-alanyl-D-glutamate--2,6-diaminopimelate ligase [Gracilibacillus sp. YIM 98692]|uniref:UDP-N-acetylmuramoyl-L-alanyl-D-glutamate--2, 6-diaminopimelate ligase n=1 Tax=Gracilibacillus sp. YIM 98692 TaxID=2663532 RepID=UPI0013D46391|nr:UDP-N-acetylmuramoyl-L-alanyl-D-glutamate--2,6-diaminopimelate ligase [Gracilibacillus sp. YIM 98692]